MKLLAGVHSWRCNPSTGGPTGRRFPRQVSGSLEEYRHEGWPEARIWPKCFRAPWDTGVSLGGGLSRGALAIASGLVAAHRPA